MNTNIISLPDSMQRQWRVYERGLGHHMRQNGAGTDEISHVLEALKPVFLRYATQNLSATIDPTNPEAAVMQLNAWVHGIVGGLLEEVAAREIQLFRLEGPK